ncbi:MAG: hypothetical protein GX910_01995 [Clostridiaceae bacterium]|nr:hypothetical protein [Clostridiaceae bacterium]
MRDRRADNADPETHSITSKAHLHLHKIKTSLRQEIVKLTTPIRRM